MDTLTQAHTDTLTARALYDVDFYQWVFYNADLLRQGKFTEIDLENISRSWRALPGITKESYWVD